MHPQPSTLYFMRPLASMIACTSSLDNVLRLHKKMITYSYMSYDHKTYSMDEKGHCMNNSSALLTESVRAHAARHALQPQWFCTILVCGTPSTPMSCGCMSL